MIRIAFWDMDHTVIDNDCDVSWKEFLVDEGVAPAADRAQAEQFYQDYLNGCLDPQAFSDFQLREFRGRTRAEMATLSQRHFDQVVADTIYSEARARIAEQLASGIEVILLTATNREIAAPVARALHIPQILATELEMIDDRFTGKITGIYCCAEGKAQVLQNYAASRDVALADCAYYGDSDNDVPVLRIVGHPFTVNPGAALQKTAQDNHWNVLRF